MSENIFKPGKPAPPPQITWVRFEDERPTKHGVYLIWDEQNRRGQYMYTETVVLDELLLLFYSRDRGFVRRATHWALFKEFTND